MIFIKKLFFLLFMIGSVFHTLNAQDFEGIVHYESKFVSKDSTIPAGELSDYFGTQTISYFKNGFYKELTNSQYMRIQLWRHDKEAIYYKHGGDEDTLRYTSTSFNEKLPFEYMIFKNSDTILNRVCDKLIIKDGISTRTYYYSSDLSLDPSYYINYDKAYKNAIVEIMQAYYLKLTLDFPLFNVEITATKIEEQELDDEIFSLPHHRYLKEEDN